MADSSIRVLRQAITVSGNDVAECCKIALNGTPIFNPDNRRFQNDVSKTLPIVERVLLILDRHGFLRRRCLGGVVVIHSKKGCKRQQWHTDYDPDQLKNLRRKPLGVIVALQSKTFFSTPDCVHVLEAGDILCFTGDVIHAGSAYDKENTRLHFYLDVEEHIRPHNKTWLVASQSLKIAS